MLSELKAFVLKLENEEKLFLHMNEVLNNQLNDIKSKYEIGLKIDSFLKSISKVKDRAEKERLLAEFQEHPVTEKRKMGDYFYVDFDSSDEIKTVYGIRFCKGVEYHLPDNASSAYYQARVAIATLGEKSIVSSVQYFEELFSSILRVLILSNPNQYFANKTVSYKELMSSDIETIKQKTLDTEVDSLMHGVSNTIKYVNEKHDLRLSNYQALWDKYVEIDKHRNIIIHNKGCVNEDYNSNVIEKYKNPVGTYIKCDKQTVHDSIYALIKFAYLLCYITGTTEGEFNELDSVAFDFLCKENWELAEFAYSLLKKHKPAKHEFKINYEINYLNSVKHLKGLDSIRTQLNELDVSGMEERFSIAKNLLLENNEMVLEQLEESYPAEFDLYSILSWPIFIEFRKSEEYKKFISWHSKDFARYEFGGDDTNES